MAQAVEAKALEINVAVVFSVVDRGGNTLLMQRMDEAFVTSCDISLNKAWTACCLRRVPMKLPTRSNQDFSVWFAANQPTANYYFWRRPASYIKWQVNWRRRR
jgi:uncharacterized protein GlcG (DUF336 family)